MLVLFPCVQPAGHNSRDVLMTFGTLICFNSMLGVTENGSDPINFWVTSYVTPYFEKELYE